MNRAQLKQSLQPGAIKEIAQKLGVSYPTVNRFLNDKSIKNDKIEIAVLEYILDMEKRKAELYKELQSL